MPVRNNQIPSPVPPPQMTEEQAKIGAEVQKARDALYGAIAQYRAQLQDSTLATNRSKMQKDGIDKLFQDLNSFNGGLEKTNVGEGPLALIFTGLNSVLNLKDQINELKFSNALLLRRMDELEGKAVKNGGTG